MTDNYTRPFQLRLTPSQAELLKQKATAAGWDVSTFVRVSCGLEDAPRRQDPRPAGFAVWEQVSRLKNNLDQIARLTSGETAEALAEVSTLLDGYLARGMRENVAPKLDPKALANLQVYGVDLNGMATEANAKKAVAPELAQAAYDTAADAAELLAPALAALGWGQPEQNEG